MHIKIPSSPKETIHVEVVELTRALSSVSSKIVGLRYIRLRQPPTLSHSNLMISAPRDADARQDACPESPETPAHVEAQEVTYWDAGAPEPC